MMRINKAEEGMIKLNVAEKIASRIDLSEMAQYEPIGVYAYKDGQEICLEFSACNDTFAVLEAERTLMNLVG